MVIRVFRNWWAKARLVSKLGLGHSTSFFARNLLYPECEEEAHSGRPHLRPYEGLAEMWQGYATFRQPNYSAFLKGLAKSGRLQLRSVLDLACGTGMLTIRLARLASEVVGLDASEPMLAHAHKCSAGLSRVRFVQGDFRDFQLGQRFDAVVCAFNSLNYVGDVAELRAVFLRVAEHLQPNGLFVFDTTTEVGMQMLSGLYLHAETDGKRFAIRFDYDRRGRKEQAVVLLPSGAEIHRRIPIDPKDVEEASLGTGLVVEDYFSSALISGRWYTGPTCFFVLSRAASMTAEERARA